MDNTSTDTTTTTPPATVDRSAELEQLTRDRDALVEALDTTRRERDALQRDLDEVLGSVDPSRHGADVDPAEAALALCEVYRVSQAVGGERRQRYLDAALRAGDRLADVVLGPVAPPPAG